MQDLEDGWFKKHLHCIWYKVQVLSDHTTLYHPVVSLASIMHVREHWASPIIAQQRLVIRASHPRTLNPVDTLPDAHLYIFKLFKQRLKPSLLIMTFQLALVNRSSGPRRGQKREKLHLVGRVGAKHLDIIRIFSIYLNSRRMPARRPAASKRQSLYLISTGETKTFARPISPITLTALSNYSRETSFLQSIWKDKALSAKNASLFWQQSTLKAYSTIKIYPSNS